MDESEPYNKPIFMSVTKRDMDRAQILLQAMTKDISQKQIAELLANWRTQDATGAGKPQLIFNPSLNTKKE